MTKLHIKCRFCNLLVFLEFAIHSVRSLFLQNKGQ